MRLPRWKRDGGADACDPRYEPYDGDEELAEAFLSICREDPGPDIDERILAAAARAAEMDRPSARLRRFLRRRRRALAAVVVTLAVLIAMAAARGVGLGPSAAPPKTLERISLTR